MKEVQTEPQWSSVSCMISLEVRSVSTQLEPVMNYFGVQCIIEKFGYVDKDEASQSDYESSESEYHQSEGEYDDESVLEVPSNCSTNTLAKNFFIVY